ncbi:GDP-mannose 4,6-dehydratase [Phosphitispora sp. TUW77]|uniref:GDP-mannose 4,6-dehydratase n=1 Tax=Phosphitispora sp. TUW77 TaxID=3152361 RepID=UPI003AB6F918
MKYLFTGISGFVGGHFVEHLLHEEKDCQIIGISKHEPEFSFLEKNQADKILTYQISLLDQEAIEDLLFTIKPDYIIHLASYSSVAFSWEFPVESFMNNTNIFLNMVEAVRKIGISAKILSVGSSEQYGIVDPKTIPIDEGTLLNPINPYAVARVAQENLSQVYYKGYGIPVICTRSFNHVGPRQSDTFVISSFVKQAVEIKTGLRNKLICGDTSIVRDFIDVRDVVGAYYQLLKKGREGQVYNICSGKGYRLSEVIEVIKAVLGVEFEIEIEKSFIRPVDNPVIIGSNRKLSEEVQFCTKYELHDSIRDIGKYWSEVLAGYYFF